MAKRVSSPYELIDRIRGLMGKVEPGDRIENWRKEVMPERFGDKGLPGKVKRGSGTDHKPVRGGGMAETHSSPCARKMGGGVARKRTVRFAGEGGDKKSHRKDIAGTERKVHEHKTSSASLKHRTITDLQVQTANNRSSAAPQRDVGMVDLQYHMENLAMHDGPNGGYRW